MFDKIEPPGPSSIRSPNLTPDVSIPVIESGEVDETIPVVVFITVFIGDR